MAPADEGRKIFFWTSAAVGLSIVMFVVIRLFAREPPGTMTQEYQEMTNEYLKVCLICLAKNFVVLLGYIYLIPLINADAGDLPEPKCRAPNWYIVGRIRGQGTGAK